MGVRAGRKGFGEGGGSLPQKCKENRFQKER